LEGSVVRAELQAKARYLAYRWYRQEDLEASHGPAWAFACANWERFLPEACQLLEDAPADRTEAVA
jgi:hypothetical protein